MRVCVCVCVCVYVHRSRSLSYVLTLSLSHTYSLSLTHSLTLIHSFTQTHSQLGPHPLILPPFRQVLPFRVRFREVRQVLAQFLQEDGRPGPRVGIDLLPHDGVLAKDGTPAPGRVPRETVHHVPDRLVDDLALSVEDDRPALGSPDVGRVGGFDDLAGESRKGKGPRKGPAGPHKVPDPVGLDRIVGRESKGVGLEVREGPRKVRVGLQREHQVLLDQGSDDGPPKDKVLVVPPIRGGILHVVPGHGHELLGGKKVLAILVVVVAVNVGGCPQWCKRSCASNTAGSEALEGHRR
mmetsp:Transcript_4518/g.12999  ORF Transcript_4518/g.12999 Transcript_4518/m.12999 type:complete len:295 (+) Transcript_4518:279-1163(+)